MVESNYANVSVAKSDKIKVSFKFLLSFLVNFTYCEQWKFIFLSIKKVLADLSWILKIISQRKFNLKTPPTLLWREVNLILKWIVTAIQFVIPLHLILNIINISFVLWGSFWRGKSQQLRLIKFSLKFGHP